MTIVGGIRRCVTCATQERIKMREERKNVDGRIVKVKKKEEKIYIDIYRERERKSRRDEL